MGIQLDLSRSGPMRRAGNLEMAPENYEIKLTFFINSMNTLLELFPIIS